MKQFFRRYGFMVFLSITVLHLVSITFELQIPRIATKLLLMPILALTVFVSTLGRYRNLLIIALFFSFLGDLFLLLDHQHPLFFIFGLVAFLITHIFYISFFLQVRSISEVLNPARIVFPLLVVLYGAGLVSLLYPSLGNLKIAVILYALIICCMLICAINCFGTVTKKAGQMFVGGALVFVISDSLLAINKFHQSFSSAAVLVMLTYCAAQYFIVKGFVTYKRSRNYS